MTFPITYIKNSKETIKKIVFQSSKEMLDF